MYSSGITPEELIADLKKANITSVHYFIVSEWDGSKNDQLFKEEYINALEENNIGIWLMVLGNCFYGDTSLPQEWKMELLSRHTPAMSISIHFTMKNLSTGRWKE